MKTIAPKKPTLADLFAVERANYMMKRWSLSFIGIDPATGADPEPLEFETREAVDAMVDFIKQCPVSDGPVRLVIREWVVAKEEEIVCT